MKTFRLGITLPKKYDSMFLEPVSDVHRDDVNFVKAKWDEVIDRIRNDPNRYTIGMGDYGSQIYTNPNERRGAETIKAEFKDNPVLLYETLVSELTPIKKKILLLLQGNHDLTVEKNSHVNLIKEMFCKPLGVPYGGYTAMVYLTVTNGTITRNWRLYVTHGKFGGLFPTNALQKLERMSQGFDSDVYLMGDRHDLLMDKRPMLTISPEGKLVSYDRIFGLSGCFVSGYNTDVDTTSYPELIMGLPNRVGTLTVEFKLSNARVYAHV